MRVCAVVVLSVLLPLPALPQCSFTPVLSDPFRLSVYDVAVDGNDLWTATSYGVALYDRSVDPPRLTASAPVPGPTRIVRLGGGFAYAGSGNTLVVLRKNGNALQILRTIDAGAPVNDIVVTTLSLYVATGNGIAQYDLLDPTSPAKTTATFPTSRPAVSSLALVGSILYAADGDSTVEKFDVSIRTTPQPAGMVAVSGSAIAVHANNTQLFVSSAVQTTVLLGSSAQARLPLSITSLAPIPGDAVFAGGTDRTLRGIDLSTPGTPIDIFRDDLPPSGGTVNRINAVATAGGRLYVAAGDIGLVTYDVSSFSPFPMRGQTFRGASSILSLGDKFYAGSTAGVTEFNQTLVPARSWDGGRSDVVRDGGGGLLLTSSGASMTLWALPSTIPSPVASTTFASAVSGAALIGTTAYAVLADRSLWSADFAQATPVPQKVAVALRPSSIARSGSAIALADARDDGTTQIAYYAASLSGTPVTVSLSGLPTTGVTLSGATAAVQTFRGISIVDFAAGATHLLPQSNDVVARQLLLSGTTLLELTDSTLRVLNAQTGSRTAEVTLPAQPIAVHLAESSTTADVATATGVVTVALDRLSRMPARNLPPNANAYYKKIAVSANRIYLLDSRGIDIFTTSMHFVGSIRSVGIVDMAANDSGVYTLNSNMTVNAYTPEGPPRASAQISEGSDVQALSIFTVNGAVWASLIRGCTLGTCEKRTVVFGAGLNQSISLSGAVVDVVTGGDRAYAIADHPSEIRVIKVSDAIHPSIVNSIVSDGTPLSIAYSNGTIYVLGNNLVTYAESSLAKTGDLLGPYTSDGTVTYADQHVRVDGNCAVVTGRMIAPQLFTLPQWTAAASFASPSPARQIAIQPGTLYVLTDHSLEIWSTAPLPKPPRRPPAR